MRVRADSISEYHIRDASRSKRLYPVLTYGKSRLRLRKLLSGLLNGVLGRCVNPLALPYERFSSFHFGQVWLT